MHVSTGSWGVQKRASDALELELQVAADIGAELKPGSSGRAAKALNHWALPPAPVQYVLISIARQTLQSHSRPNLISTLDPLAHTQEWFMYVHTCVCMNGWMNECGDEAGTQCIVAKHFTASYIPSLPDLEI